MTKNITTKQIAYFGLFAALTYVGTALIHVPLPNGGYIHVGNIPIIIAACLFGWKFGAGVGAIGSTLADALVPLYAPYAPFTFVIKLLMGALVGVAVRKKGIISYILYALAGLVVVGGYYAAEVLFSGNWLTPFMYSIPYTIEYVGSLVIGLIVSKRLAKHLHDKRMK